MVTTCLACGGPMFGTIDGLKRVHECTTATFEGTKQDIWTLRSIYYGRYEDVHM